MALIVAATGDRDGAVECLVRATSLANPAVAYETERFSSESASKFEFFKGQWNHMHNKGGA